MSLFENLLLDYEEAGYSQRFAEENAFWLEQEYLGNIDEMLRGSTEEEREMLFSAGKREEFLQ